MAEAVLLAARSQMLLEPSVINLNTGSFGPLPRAVFDHVTALRRRLAEEPMDFFVRQVPPLLWNARERLAGFLHVDPRRLFFTANVSVSVNILANCLRLVSPGEILITDHEYGSLHWCWERAAERQGLTLRTFPLPLTPNNSLEIVAAFLKAANERTRLLFFSHILSPTGMILPARELCAEAKKRGIITVVDGAHAPGMIPLDVGDIGCDFYGSNCHKWLLAPSGSGFLYFASGQEDRLEPLQVSWGYHYDRSRADERDEFGSTPRLRALEFEGTRDPCAWLAVPTAIDFLESLGFDRIRKRQRELAAHVRLRLGEVKELKLITPGNPDLHGSLTAYRMPADVDLTALRRLLWDHRVELNVFEKPEGPVVRFSTHFYNTEEEIDKAAMLLPRLISQCRPG